MTDEHSTSVATDDVTDRPSAEEPEVSSDAETAEKPTLGLFPELPKPPIWQTAVALVAYLVLWAVWSWPLVEDPNQRLVGAIGDQTGFLSLYRELHQEGLLGFMPGTINDFAAPEGLEYGWVNLFGQLPASLLASILFAIFTPLGAVAMYTTIGVVGTAFSMYLLARRLTGSALAAFIGGLGCGFAPFIVFKTSGHADFSHAWVFVLMLWSWLRLIDAPSWKRVTVVAGAMVLAAAWTAYFALLAAVAGLVLALIFIGTQIRRRHGLRAIAMAAATGVPAVVWIGITLYIASNEPLAVTQPTRSLFELTVYAARPLEFLVPGPRSMLFGEWATKWRFEHMHGSNLSESLLYLGASVMLLALVGLVVSVVRRKNLGLIAILAAVGLTAMWFSFPPQVAIGGHLIPTPSKYLFEVQPGFRVYSRFVLLMIVMLAPVAALGVAAILRWVKYPAAQLAVVAGLTLVMAGDLKVGAFVNPTSDPPSYVALRQQPPGLVAEMPFVPAVQEVNQATYYQDLGNHPILNGYREGSIQEARALQLTDLSSPRTMAGLRAIGVKYVVARTDFDFLSWPDPGAPSPKDARLIKEDRSLKLYEVKDGPANFAFWYPDASPTERDIKKQPYQWLTADGTTLHVYGDCDNCDGEAIVKLSAFGPDRQVTLDSGVAKRVVTVTPAPKEYRVPIRVKNGRAEVRLTSNPGAVRPSELDPANPDNRLLALALYEPKVEVEDGG